MKKETKEKIKNYKNQYDKEHYKHIAIKLHLERDADIIELLAKQSNISDFIKKKLRN